MRNSLRLVLSAPSLLLLGAIAVASPTGDEAIAVLKSADAKLQSLQSLKAKYVEVESYPGSYRDLRQTGDLEISRPGSVRLEIVRSRRIQATDPWKDSGNTTLSVSDGADRYAIFFHAHSTQVRRTEADQSRVLNEVPILSGFFGGRTSPAAEVANAQSQGDLESISADGSKTIKYRVGDLEKAVTVGDDGLIHHLEVHSIKTGANQDWTLTTVTENAPVNSADFHYSPPKDAIPYDALNRKQVLPVGSDAPAFTVVDPSGRQVSLADYKGKVVVLKFWATWCWPCNQSLPHTNEVASAFGGDVATLAIAIHDNKKGFDSWLSKHRQFGAIRFLFEDPSSSGPSSDYHVTATPTEYVIGRDGKIAAAFTGFTGPNDDLSNAIKLALSH